MAYRVWVRTCVGLTLFVALTYASGALAQQHTPGVHFTDLEGHEQSLASYSGKIVVLNFWATWCVPCRHEMPMLNELAPKYADRGVVFVTASVDEAKTQHNIARFVEKSKITLPVWLGATSDTLKEFDLGEVIPATIIFDRDGTAMGRIFGQARQKDITSRLDWLLSDRADKAPKASVKRY